MEDIAADQILSFFAQLDMHCGAGPTAERLKAHGPGACKDIVEGFVFDDRSQDIEDGFASEIACRPDGTVHWAFEFESLTLAGNDAHLLAWTYGLICGRRARTILVSSP